MNGNNIEDLKNIVNIKVIGVGGGGNNTIHSMIKEGIKGVEFIAANTDEQVLNNSNAHIIMPLGATTSKGLGAGANPENGKQAALESESEIKETIKGADMIIIAAGLGGGTGTGAAPEIARISRELGILTVGVVTTPFSFEGSKRTQNATKGLENIRKYTDSLIVISNNKLLDQFGEISLKDSFLYADKVIKHTVRTITDLIVLPSIINLDFADVTTVIKDKGSAVIGIGVASGEDRAVKAAIHAISSPILESSIHGATDAIINVSGNSTLTLLEAQKAVETISKAVGSNLNVIFGTTLVENDSKSIQVSVIATGIDLKKNNKSKEIVEVIKNLDVELDNEKTREILMEDPFPEIDKLSITDEVELQSENINLDDEESDLPAFLRS